MFSDVAFSLHRISAINDYARLETVLCDFMRTLIGCDHHTGRVIFYNLTNTRSRYAIIAKLVKTKLDGTYAPAWPRVEKWLIKLDAKRNKLVHWVEQDTVDLPNYDNMTIEEAAKAMPKDITILWNNKTYYNHDSDGESMSLSDIQMFSKEVKIQKQILTLLFRCSSLDHLKMPLREKFRQPPAHQNPEEFLQFLIHEGQPATPPPSPR